MSVFPLSIHSFTAPLKLGIGLVLTRTTLYCDAVVLWYYVVMDGDLKCCGDV